MMSRTFTYKITGNVSFNAHACKKLLKGEELDRFGWLTTDPSFVGKILVVDKDVYGYLDSLVFGGRSSVRGVVVENFAIKAPGLAFYRFPTNNKDFIQAFIVPDLAGERFNYWTMRGLFDWYSPEGQVKVKLEARPYNIEALRDEINDVCGQANKASRANQKIAQQIEQLKHMFRNAVRVQEQHIINV